MVLRFLLPVCLLFAGLDGEICTHAAEFSTNPAKKMVSSGSCVNIPAWVIHPPKDAFIGISKPCRSIQEARDSALDSALSQVLQSMGAEYSLSHHSTLSANNLLAHYQLTEEITLISRWVIRSVQQNVLETCIHKEGDAFTCFLLLHISGSQLETLRKLSQGPKISGRIVKSGEEKTEIHLCEIRNVAATLTDYKVTVLRIIHYARILTLFAWSVPDSSAHTVSGPLPSPCFLKGDFQKIVVPSVSPPYGSLSIFPGSETKTTIFLYGHDDLGRKISVSISESK